MTTTDWEWEAIKLAAGKPPEGMAHRLVWNAPVVACKPLAALEHIKTWVLICFTFGFIGFMLTMMVGIVLGVLS